VIRAREVSYAWGDLEVVSGLSTTVERGDKVGLIGPNGSGKTTLLRLLLGDLEPDEGTVERGTGLEIAYFDQHRDQLDDEASVADNVAGGSDHVLQEGERRHVLSYLQDFLFPPERARQPVKALSGGERNRLLLARLFTRPANLLVLDEPTNDLDMETLELLEDRLVAFPGTVLVVSHDRAFLDNLCTQTLVFEGNGRVREYAGGYSDWRRVVERRAAPDASERPEKAPPKTTQTSVKKEDKGQRLSYHEKRELADLPARIEALEAELADLHALLSQPDFYKGEGEAVREATARAGVVEAAIEEAFARWESLAERG
jgi:ATP-binding cassette subfamily F protein uup